MKRPLIGSGLMTRVLLTAVLALSAAASLAAEPAPDTRLDTRLDSRAPAMETVIVGDRDSAVGLYLLPWREEAASDIDLPPRRHEEAAQALDAARFRRTVADEQANAAYRQVRLEPRP